MFFILFYKISVTNLSNRRFSSNKNSYRKMFYHEKELSLRAIIIKTKSMKTKKLIRNFIALDYNWCDLL